MDNERRKALREKYLDKLAYSILIAGEAVQILAMVLFIALMIYLIIWIVKQMPLIGTVLIGLVIVFALVSLYAWADKRVRKAEDRQAR